MKCPRIDVSCRPVDKSVGVCRARERVCPRARGGQVAVRGYGAPEGWTSGVRSAVGRREGRKLRPRGTARRTTAAEWRATSMDLPANRPNVVVLVLPTGNYTTETDPVPVLPRTAMPPRRTFRYPGSSKITLSIQPRRRQTIIFTYSNPFR